MALTTTPRLLLAKQGLGDSPGAWHTAQNQGMDDADARLLRVGVVDPDGVEDSDYIGQQYFDTVTEIWYTATNVASPGAWSIEAQSVIAPLALKIDNDAASPSVGAGDTVSQPAAPATGHIYLNTEIGTLERYNGAAYQTFSGTLQRGALDGLGINRLSATSLLISEGECRIGTIADQNISDFRSPSDFTKDFALVWASGSTNNGIPNALSPLPTVLTTYHLFAIGDEAGLVDYAYDNTILATNILADANIMAFFGANIWVRRIFSFVSDATPEIVDFTHFKNHFMYALARGLDYNDTINDDYTGSSSPILFSHVPVQIAVEPVFTAVGLNTSGTSLGLFASGGDGISADPSSTTSPIGQWVMGNTTLYQNGGMITNASQELRFRSNDNSVQLRIETMGYIDYRGKYS